MPEQFTLTLDLPQVQSFDNFIAGNNQELLDVMSHLPRSAFTGIWIYGPLNSGRSHLLRACCLSAHQQGAHAAYVGCSEYAAGSTLLHDAIRYVVDHGDLIALDDVGCIVGDQTLELQLLTIYQRLLMSEGHLLVVHDKPASALEFATQDLGSRMRSLQHFEVRTLDDEQKAHLLRSRAKARGYELSEAVVSYWLVRGPRDLSALLTDLDRLDHASLEHQRKVTVPLLKSVLGY